MESKKSEFEITIERNLRRAKLRKERDEAMRSLGLKRVRGALGGIYWE